MEEERWHRLTERQQEILRYIWEFAQDRGFPPSIREIGQAVGISSTSVVNYNLERLEKEEWIERTRGRSRGLRLSQAGQSLFTSPESGETLSIPLLGVIAAGTPIPSDALPIDEITLTQGIIGGDVDDLYALRVQGNSMIDALVHDGDVVIMQRAEQVENGEMAAVWLRDSGETTLKKVYWDERPLRLQPANPTMDPIYVQDPNQVEVQGKVVMVIRTLH